MTTLIPTTPLASTAATTPSFTFMLLILLGLALTYAALLYAGARRLKNLLHYFQQEEYDSLRFAQWWWQAPGFDKRLSLALLLVLLLALLIPGGWEYAAAPIILLLATRFEADPTKSAKKPLVFTARAQRIYGTALALYALIMALLFGTALYAHAGSSHLTLLWLWPALLLLVQLLPDTLLIANFALKPYEAWVQRRLLAEAKAKLQHLQPTVIGITGSFGKTSTKHILFHILAAAAPTLMTPGSVNTLMGITRIIREQLRPEHRFFVVEMGDYQPGAVAEKCALVPPTISAITAVGIEHFERFKSMDAIAKTKFEIATDTWARGGVCVINGTQLPAAYHGYLTHPQLTRLISDVPQAGAFTLHDVQQTAAGLRLRLQPPSGNALEIQTPLYGLQHASNIAVAAVLALELGVPASTITMALQSVPQTKHRLEVKRGVMPYTIIDDAYNSNPAGFAAALDILDLIGRAQHNDQHNGQPRGQRILVTPGMVELGTLHDPEHARLGTIAATKTDWIIAINAARFPSFVAAARAANPSLRLDEVPHMAAALALLNEKATAADTVLLENDLPDLYEHKPKF